MGRTVFSSFFPTFMLSRQWKQDDRRETGLVSEENESEIQGGGRGREKRLTITLKPNRTGVLT